MAKTPVRHYCHAETIQHQQTHRDPDCWCHSRLLCPFGHRPLASPRDRCSDHMHQFVHVNDHCPCSPAEATPEDQTSKAIAGGEC